jgi:hypothetical protein
MIHKYLCTGALTLLLFSTLSAATSSHDSLSAAVSNSEAKSMVYKKGAVTYYPSLSLRGGIMSTDLNTMNESMRAGTGKMFNYNLFLAGLTGNFPVHIRGVGAFDCNVDLNYMIPQSLTFGSSSSIKLSGFALGFGAGQDLFPHNINFDLILGAGFQGGMLRLRSTYTGSTTSDPVYSKSFFAPQVTLYPRFNFGAVFVGVRGSYHYDVLSGNWKGSSSTAVSNPDWSSQATGYTIEAVFGFVLGNHY